MHAAIPCAPWTAWQHFNYARGSPTFRRNLLKRRTESLIILDHWKQIASYIHSNGGFNSYEWPRFCSGWVHIVDFFPSIGMRKADCDGCALGSATANGKPIKKPWSIWSSWQPMVDALSSKVCDISRTRSLCWLQH